MAALGVLAPDVEPKATEHIPEMVALIERLVAKGVAYPVDGDVYFEVARFPAYGQLSGKNLDELLAGRPRRRGRAQARPARLRAVEGGEARRAVVAEPVGPGPAGLAHRVLGHGDAATWARRSTSTAAARTSIFPHHEYEIAQSEARDRQALRALLAAQRLRQPGRARRCRSRSATRSPSATLVTRHDPEALRLYPARHPLPQPARVRRGARRGRRASAGAPLRALDRRGRAIAPGHARGRDRTAALPTRSRRFRAAVRGAMDDDFNTPEALGVLFDLAGFHGPRAGGAGTRGPRLPAGRGRAGTLAGVLGLLRGAPGAAGRCRAKARVESLVEVRAGGAAAARTSARPTVRAEIEQLGAILEDSPAATGSEVRGRERAAVRAQPRAELLRGDRTPRVEEIAMLAGAGGPLQSS